MPDQSVAPTIRVRINHEQTAKGWRTKETTVEVAFRNELDPESYYVVPGIAGSDDDTSLGLSSALAFLLQEVAVEAEAETIRRNTGGAGA